MASQLAFDEKNADAATTTDAEKSANNKDESTKTMMECTLSVDLDSGSVSVSYKNKILVKDIDAFIDSYLLSNIFKTNDKIISYISSHDYNLVKEFKNALSIMYTIDVLDFNIIFEIPFDDFELDLTKCDKQDQSNILFHRIKELNQIIALNDLIYERHDLTISKPFQNFTLRECIDEITKLLNTCGHGQHTEGFAKAQLLRNYAYSVYTVSGKYSSCVLRLSLKDQFERLLPKDSNIVIATGLMSRDSYSCMVFDDVCDYKYHLNVYSDRITIGHNRVGTQKHPRELILHLHPDVYDEVRGGYLTFARTFWCKDLVIGKIGKKLGHTYESRAMLQVDLSASGFNHTGNISFLYLPVIDGDDVRLKYVACLSGRKQQLEKYPTGGSGGGSLDLPGYAKNVKMTLVSDTSPQKTHYYRFYFDTNASFDASELIFWKKTSV